MEALEHLYQKGLIPLNVFGIDLTITNGVITLWLAAVSAFLFFFLSTRRLKQVPAGWQNLAEALILFLRDEVAGQIKRDRDKWLPFLVSIFSFILFCNLIGLIPDMSGVTGNINTTAALAIVVFLVVQIAGIRSQGVIGYFKSIVPPGLPLPITLFMIPIEIVGQLAKPFSLALRLFANMFAGHAVMLMIFALIFVFKSYFILPLPVIGNTAVMAFEIFVAFIQAFIFTYLSAMYIATATEGGH
ncbi:ATP synthase F0 subunit A [candidate division WOR-1 bacterium RIFCSPHIGHO2_01_FULL_53_15]|uniref:ATP synthase subunit a n=1 Tax=candidate division WOR-1 bacterium RIFCSPHIGHO2_01_FULL_53_15 TaxID=1802564 RepID=A0A1F4Q3C7_UNCSA|nr:MAG: ATP synthase F0 subunit A [candidate division WOR-1 bacterium RIFCSPHIGHO2_01_FULL_53_15]OGC12806.1 MAG: ATP synthase F0 subunit A [candidate division WOR-1 bacterium RIFCSPHIGHO2_02_FULL_53_26]